MRILTDFLKGIRWTSFAMLISAGGGLLQLFVLLLFLEKADFAFFALAAVFINVGLQLQEAGINPAIIQKRVNDSTQLSSIFCLNQLIAIFLFLLVWLFQFPLATFYEAPELGIVLQHYSFVFLLNGLGVQYRFLLQQQLKFKILAAVESFSLGVGFILAMLLAMNGWGVFSLVYATLFRYASLSTGAIYFVGDTFRLQLVLDWAGIKEHIHFSKNHLSERLLTHFVSQLDILLIGKLLGAEILGVYDVFKRLLMRPVGLLSTTIEKVSFPLFAEIQNDQNATRTLYLTILNTLCSLVFPVYCLLLFWTTFILELYYGLEWLNYSSTFQWVCILSGLTVISHPVDTFLLARGRIHYWFYTNFFSAPVLILIFYNTVPYGLDWVIIGLILFRVFFNVAIFQFILKQELIADFWTYFKATLLPLGLTFGGSFILLAFEALNIGDLWGRIVSSICFLFFYFLGSLRFNVVFRKNLQFLFSKNDI